MISPAEAAQAVPDLVAEVRAMPEVEQAHGYRHLLRANVHDVVMRWSVNGPDHDPAQLASLAEAVRTHVPDGAEEHLSARVRVFVRLLRQDRFEPAWTLAHDNAAGVVRPERQASLWAGGSYLSSQLAMPTLVEAGRVYAWLPGFRDPRWGVADEVYLVDDKVVLRNRLELATFRGSVLRVDGSAYLGLLTAAPDDKVTLVWDGPDDAVYRVACVRGRRPDLVTQTGPDSTRLAWGGWRADVLLPALAAYPGVWRARIEVVQQGVHRIAPLGRTRGPLAEAPLTSLPYRSGRHTFRMFGAGRDGSLSVVVHPYKPVEELTKQVKAKGRGAVRALVR